MVEGNESWRTFIGAHRKHRESVLLAGRERCKKLGRMVRHSRKPRACSCLDHSRNVLANLRLMSYPSLIQLAHEALKFVRLAADEAT
jgi:hypothetical protein